MLSLSVAQHENEDDDAFPKCGAKLKGDYDDAFPKCGAK